MATLAPFLSISRPPRVSQSSSYIPPPPFILSFLRRTKPLPTLSPSSRTPAFSCLASRTGKSGSKKSVLANLIQEIEPLDVSLIQKDVAAMTVDAMKRTISGMLGLLPSDQFQVYIEALWEPLSKLLISSMMTGYTLRNAEYRMCLEKNLEIYDVDKYSDKEESEEVMLDSEGTLVNDHRRITDSRQDQSPVSKTMIEKVSELPNFGEKVSELPNFGEMTPEIQQYIIRLRSRLSSVKKELREVKRKSGALQMQQFVGEEKNDLLDYLRSLLPEKVVELSEPTSPEVKETIHSVVYGLLATLSPKMSSRAPDPTLTENTSISATANVDGEDCIDLVENTSLQFQPHILLTRDYLARLLFWCMLLGHYLKGLEYRLELMELLSLPYVASNGEHAV